MEERIIIEVVDKIPTSIEKKLKGIGDAAELSALRLERAKNATAASAERLKQETSKTETASNNLKTSFTRLATEQERLTAAFYKSKSAEESFNQTSLRTISLQNSLAISSEKLFQAEVNSSLALDKMTRSSIANESAKLKLSKTNNDLALSSERLFQAEAKSTVQLDNMRSASTRLSTEQAKLKTATLGTETATRLKARAYALAVTAAKNLETAEVRKATQLKRLSTETDKAALARIRLTKAEERALMKPTQKISSSGGFNIPGRGMLMSGIAALGLGLGAKEVIDLGNEYVTLTNKIKVVTDSETQHAQVMSRVFDIANTTRTSVSDTATAFQRLDMALKPLGASQSETLRMTETINKAFILGGASTQEAAGALRQLTQAFNAGKLAGDEYRSVSENAPIIMEALSRSLGKTKGELKEMSAEGKITSEVLRKAIGEAEILIDARFSKTVPTMGQAVEVLKNKLIELFGEIETNSGVLSSISSAIISISKNVNELTGPITTLIKSFDGFRKLLNIGTEKFDGWLALRRIIQLISLDIAAATDKIADLLKAVSGLAKTAKNLTPTGTMASSFSNLFFGKDYLTKFADETYNLSKSLKGSESNFNITLDRIAADEKVIENQRKQNELIAEQQKVVEKLAKSYEQLNRLKAPQAQQDIWKKKWEKEKEKLILLQGGDLSSLRPSGEGTGTGNLKSDKLGNKKGRSEKLWFTGRKFGEPGVDILQDPLERMASQSWMLTDATANLTERDLTKLNAIQTELNGILEDTIGKVNELDIKIKATQKAMQLGVDPNEALLAAFPDLLGGTRVEEDVRLKREKERYDKLKELAKDSAKGKEALRQYEAKKEMEDYQKKLGYAETFFGNLSALQQTSSKETFALGKAAALANAAIQSQQAILKIYATPDVSPWIQSAMAASVAIATGVQVANIAAAEMPGYEAGGYTGDMGTRQVAGVVHGREFVVNAAATARNRASLEAMNAGKSVGNSVSVTIENYGTSKDFEVQNNEGNLRIIARDEISRMVPTLVSAELANPNSKTSKSLARNTNTTRQR